MLSNKFRWRVRDPKLKKAVLYSYFKDAHREPDLNGGATLVLRTEPGSGGWFWYIPLENDITSVGIVADPEYLLKNRGQDLAKIFNEEIEKCESVRRRVAEGTRVDKIYSILDYSYRSKQNAGNGFILIGDAYGFLDPIYSSGVLLALKMAELAAASTRRNSIAGSSRCASWFTRSTTMVSASQDFCESIRRSAFTLSIS
jgi:flavin-dependent dehydrogenase